MNDRQPILDVIIVNFRTPELTADAIEHVRASVITSHTVRIWIVDNGSRDGSLETLRTSYPDVQVIGSGKNLGFAGGNNVALARIVAQETTGPRDGSFVLLLNSDVQVSPGAIQHCLTFMQMHPDAGVVGPRVELPDGSLDLACRRGFPTPANAFWKLTGLSRRYPASKRFSGYNLTHLPEDETAEVDAVGGAFMMVRLAAIDDAGLLDERFFMYGEDLDWAFRIKQAGWKVWYEPGAVVTHLKSASARRQSGRMIFEFYRAMWLFHAKHYAPRTFFPVNALVMIGIVARGILALMVNAFRPVERKRFT